MNPTSAVMYGKPKMPTPITVPQKIDRERMKFFMIKSLYQKNENKSSFFVDNYFLTANAEILES